MSNKYILGFLFLCALLPAGSKVFAIRYSGRIVDEHGSGLMYATVFLKDNPIVGTATNSDGYFVLESDTLRPSSSVILSCIGFASREVPVGSLAADSVVVTLQEQPILLTPATVEAKKVKQSKRKRKASILHEIYVRLQEECPHQAARYHVVSDVKMESNTSDWGMEQMVASVVQIPAADVTQKDSIQFVGKYCKRYCNPLVRKHVDHLLSGEQDKNRKRLAQSIDSGTVVHRKIWEMSQIEKTFLLDLSDELARWKINKQENMVVMTYTHTRNYLGIVKIVESHSLLVDNAASLQTYMQDIHVKVFLPFSIRVKDSNLEWLNLLNMDDEKIEKFRLKKADFTVHFETHYGYRDAVLVPQQKTMHVQGMLEDNKKHQLPCELWGNQQITKVDLSGVTPVQSYRKSQKVSRELVPIY
ncbi:MAG: carboxypeptidase-like regulatory domain-containing protein [Paludibacteraceae bacterium]|nr:carboxypeptidase-like regulatory domain-containing protein [Paludibacteraceae bacterium]